MNHSTIFRRLGCLAVALGCGQACFPAGQRVNLAPKFVAGETLVYRTAIGTSTVGKTTTPITNSEGATQNALNLAFRVIVQVLSVRAEAAGSEVRLKVTWDEAQASSASDALDPTSGDPSAPFRQLQGQSVEFTLSPAGALENFNGLEPLFPKSVPPPESVAWISSLVSANLFPRGGVSPGQQWNSESEIVGAPLAGLFWQTQTSYQRNEACPAREEQTSLRQCASLISQMAIVARPNRGRDATPDEYLRSGLRTSGTWIGKGDELGVIDIETGILMSATENSTQDMDYEIRSAASGSAIHYVAKVQTQTGITLVSDTRPAANQ